MISTEMRTTTNLHNKRFWNFISEVVVNQEFVEVEGSSVSLQTKFAYHHATVYGIESEVKRSQIPNQLVELHHRILCPNRPMKDGGANFTQSTFNSLNRKRMSIAEAACIMLQKLPYQGSQRVIAILHHLFGKRP